MYFEGKKQDFLLGWVERQERIQNEARVSDLSVWLNKRNFSWEWPEQKV